MSRWDQKTEGHSRSRRDGPTDRTRSRSRSRSRSASPVERRLREIEEQRQRKERLLRDTATQQLPGHRQRRDSGSSSGDSNDGLQPESAIPVPPVTSKEGFSFQKPAKLGANSLSTGFKMQKPKPLAIQMKLGAAPKKETPKLLKPVANAFAGEDSDDEPEEMPAECRMRMRNIGRDTPTSSGPNSFGKTKHGFCDSKKIFEKKLNTLNDS